MTKPTLEELKEWMLSKGGSIQLAEKFFYHYEMNGWRVGRNPMKSWQAGVSYWLTSERQKTPQFKVIPKQQPKPVEDDQIKRAYAKRKAAVAFERANNLETNTDAKVIALLEQGLNAYRVQAETGVPIGRIRVLKSKL